MNIFASDPCPVRSATVLADRHVVKMCVETAQVLWTALHLSGAAPVEGAYRPTHKGHPVVRWVAASRRNAAWAAAHGSALCAEYTHRYGRRHASEAPLALAAARIEAIPDGALTPFALAMDPDLRDEADPCASYRRCLARKYLDWGNQARWTRREPPSWLLRPS